MLTMGFVGLAAGLSVGFLLGYFSARPDYPLHPRPPRNGRTSRPWINR